MTVEFSRAHLYKLIHTSLLLIVIGLLLWSRPWVSSSDQIRKITVEGSATIEAEPDEWQFNPYFEATGTDQDELKASLTQKANAAIDAVKELGVPESDIKLDASSYERWYLNDGEEGTLNAYLQIKVRDNELTQKVQDYLLTTDAKGQLTPQATFSEEKKKELDRQVTEQAIDDAKEQAELQAKKFEAEVGEVLEVSQASDSVFPIAYDAVTLESSDGAARSSLPVLSGKNEYTQTVTVTYRLQ